MKYTLALIFSKTADAVLLIKKKKKPVHHIGKYNGLGGGIDLGETSLECVAREVKEEAGITLVEASFDKFAVTQSPNWSIDCYRAFIDGLDEFKALNIDEGLVEVIHLNELDEIPKVTNLLWLIELALDLDRWRIETNIYYKDNAP